MGRRMTLADLPPAMQKQVAAQLYKQTPAAPKPEKAGKRVRQSAEPILNELEKEFERHMSGEWLGNRCHIKAQALRFRLGNGVYYKPDFIEFRPSDFAPFPPPWRVTAYEVKGPHAFRGGMENLKIAASSFPEVTFKLCWKAADTGEWIVQNLVP